MAETQFQGAVVGSSCVCCCLAASICVMAQQRGRMGHQLECTFLHSNGVVKIA